MRKLFLLLMVLAVWSAPVVASSYKDDCDSWKDQILYFVLIDRFFNADKIHFWIWSGCGLVFEIPLLFFQWRQNSFLNLVGFWSGFWNPVIVVSMLTNFIYEFGRVLVGFLKSRYCFFNTDKFHFWIWSGFGRIFKISNCFSRLYSVNC